MQKTSRLHLHLAATTLRHLSSAELSPIVGGSPGPRPLASDTRTVCTHPLGSSDTAPACTTHSGDQG